MLIVLAPQPRSRDAPCATASIRSRAERVRMCSCQRLCKACELPPLGNRRPKRSREVTHEIGQRRRVDLDPKGNAGDLRVLAVDERVTDMSRHLHMTRVIIHPHAAFEILWTHALQ